MPLPRRFSAVMRATAVPGPRSSTQSGSSSGSRRATASQRTGSTNCERTGSPTTPSTGAHERCRPRRRARRRNARAARPARASGTARRRPSGDHVKRSGAPPRRPVAALGLLARGDLGEAGVERVERGGGAGDDEPRGRVDERDRDVARASSGSRRASVTPSIAAIGERPVAARTCAGPGRRRARDGAPAPRPAPPGPRPPAAPPAGPASARPAPRSSRRATASDSASAHSERHSSACASRLERIGDRGAAQVRGRSGAPSGSMHPGADVEAVAVGARTSGRGRTPPPARARRCPARRPPRSSGRCATSAASSSRTSTP